MALFQFTYSDPGSAVGLTYSCETDVWFEALDNFVKFLRGAGFRVEDDTIGINSDNVGVNGDDFMNITTFTGEH